MRNMRAKAKSPTVACAVDVESRPQDACGWSEMHSVLCTDESEGLHASPVEEKSSAVVLCEYRSIRGRGYSRKKTAGSAR